MQITELAAKVQSLGLSDKEAKVYVAALFLGPASVQKIAEQAEVNRATAYVILDQLGELGLVSQSTEGKKTVFVAEGPETLRRLFDRQIEAVEERRRDLQDLLPELQQTQRSSTGDAPIVRFYRGGEGVAAAVQEMQRKASIGATVYSMINYDEAERVAPGLLKANPTNRLKKKIASKIIYSYRKEVPSAEKFLRDTKRTIQPIKADVSLYPESAALFTYAGKNSVGVVIDSQELVGVLRQLFELAWKNQKP